jgi:hypothetical protein
MSSKQAAAQGTRLHKLDPRLQESLDVWDRIAGDMMAEGPPDFAAKYGHICQASGSVFYQRCGHSTKGVVRRAGDCYICAMVRPGLCEPFAQRIERDHQVLCPQCRSLERKRSDKVRERDRAWEEDLRSEREENDRRREERDRERRR